MSQDGALSNTDMGLQTAFDLQWMDPLAADLD